MMKEVEMKKCGLVYKGLTEALRNLKAGEIVSLKMDLANLPSCRARAAELNSKAGYTKYSVSVDSMTRTIRIKNND